jgi:GDSL-like Lipase/Acylhydrolase family
MIEDLQTIEDLFGRDHENMARESDAPSPVSQKESLSMFGCHFCFMKNISMLCLTGILTTSLVAADEKASKSTKASKATQAKKDPNPALAKIEDRPGLPRVLLIGDSISIGYTVQVRKLLEGKANVHRILTNGGPTTNGLENLKDWLGNSKWDVIHFNWGLHDLKYMGPNNENLADPKSPGSHQQVPLAEYEKNLTELVKQLQATGAKLIWCNTTPISEGTNGRVPGDEKKYNEAAARVMLAAKIPTNDLWSHAQAKLDKSQLPKNVHFSTEGSSYLAEKVAAQIQEAIK